MRSEGGPDSAGALTAKGIPILCRGASKSVGILELGRRRALDSGASNRTFAGQAKPSRAVLGNGRRRFFGDCTTVSTANALLAYWRPCGGALFG